MGFGEQMLKDKRPNEEDAQCYVEQAQVSVGIQAAAEVSEHEVQFVHAVICRLNTTKCLHGRLYDYSLKGPAHHCYNKDSLADVHIYH